MPQNFYAAFNLYDIEENTTVNTVDIDGLNVAVIQALKSARFNYSEKTSWCGRSCAPRRSSWQPNCRR